MSVRVFEVRICSNIGDLISNFLSGIVYENFKLIMGGVR